MNLNKGYLDSFYQLIRYINLFYPFIDDFISKNLDSSKKRKTFDKCPNFSKILPPARAKFGIFVSFFPPKI